MSLLGWDQETGMPSGGIRSRAAARGELAEIAHRRWLSAEFADDLAAAMEETAGAEAGESLAVELDRRLVAKVAHQHKQFLRLPAELAEESARVAAESQASWQQARKDADFALFLPDLNRIVDLKRRVADALREDGQSRYDALLDEYEPGADANEIRQHVEDIRPALVDLVDNYAGKFSKADYPFLSREYPIADQEKFCRFILQEMGYDFDRGVMAVSTHPFCSGISSPSDVRITTRYELRDPKSALFGSIHEGGHALYEQGFDPEMEGTPLASATSMGMHESQSRLWENIVGLGREFWQCYYPKFQQQFSKSLANVDLDHFLRGVNGVERSFIRVEADEVTYNLHIMLRFEIEQDLIEGKVNTADLPELWNKKMQEYLGITPADDAQGVLQDVHWSFGAFGYFPTYFLGNLYSAQLYEAAQAAMPSLGQDIASGQLLPLKEWLGREVHSRGAVYSAGEICELVTGRPLESKALVNYLSKKLADLYG